jgi:phospholipase D-like protein
MAPPTWTDYFFGFLPCLMVVSLWLIPVLIAFARLRKETLDDTAKAIWVLIILILPVVGPLTYLVLFSGKQRISEK